MFLMFLYFILYQFSHFFLFFVYLPVHFFSISISLFPISFSFVRSVIHLCSFTSFSFLIIIFTFRCFSADSFTILFIVIYYIYFFTLHVLLFYPSIIICCSSFCLVTVSISLSSPIFLTFARLSFFSLFSPNNGTVNHIFLFISPIFMSLNFGTYSVNL